MCEGQTPPLALDHSEARLKALVFRTVPQPVTAGVLTLEGGSGQSQTGNGSTWYKNDQNLGKSGTVFLVDPSGQEEELVRTVTVVVGSKQELLVVQHNDSSPSSARGGGVLSHRDTQELVSLCQNSVAAQ